MAKKKVFISYDHSEDLLYKNLLLAWHANASFEFEFDQRSPNVPINSDDAVKIKQSLTTMMKAADYLLVIIGAKSHTSKWMAWEIDRAKQWDTRLKLAAIKIGYFNTTPPGLLGCGVSFATAFEQDKIIDALNKARNDYP
jgi:hypothetical protein